MMDINQQSAGNVPNELDIGSWEEIQFEGLPPLDSQQAPSSYGSEHGLNGPPFKNTLTASQLSRSDSNVQMMSFLSGSSAVFDLDVEELQNKIRNVLVENMKLRDAIRESSASLRRQCDVLVVWRVENQRLREERRQVAEHCHRAREIIAQLREENADLKLRVAQPEAESGDSVRSSKHQEPVAPSWGEPLEPAGAEVELRSQISCQAAELRESQLEVSRLQAKLARQEAELTACRQTGRAAHQPSGELVAANLQLRDENTSLRSSLEAERRQRLELVAWLAGDQRYTPVLETLRQSDEVLRSSQQALDAHAARLMATGRALDALSAHLQPHGEPSDPLVTELAALRAELARCTANAARDAAQGGEAASALQRLRQVFDSVAARWEGDAATHDTPTGTEQQVHSDALQARILSMEELLAARGAETERLQRQVLQLRRDLQAIDILKAQVDVYQQDFNQERRQREQLVAERDQLRLEVSQLQARQRQLLARPLAGQGITTADSAEVAQPPPSRPDPDRQPTVYTCPKCDMAFLDVEPLQNHANRCLDSD